MVPLHHTYAEFFLLTEMLFECEPRTVVRVRVRRSVIRIRIDETAIRIRIVVGTTNDTAVRHSTFLIPAAALQLAAIYPFSSSDFWDGE